MAIDVVKHYDRGMPRIVHVLWSPQTGPICVYEDPTAAWDHAQAMLGVEVASAELRTELPDFVPRSVPPDADTPTTIAIEDIGEAEEPDEW